MTEIALTPEQAEQACPDCPAVVRHRRDVGLFGPLPAVTVEHAATCPRCRHLGPSDVALRSGPDGIIMHFRRDDTAEASTAVGVGDDE